MRLSLLAFTVVLLGSRPAPASTTLDAEASAAVVAAWRASLGTANYPRISVLVEYREKWADNGQYVLLVIEGNVVTASCLLLNTAPNPETSEPPPPT